MSSNFFIRKPKGGVKRKLSNKSDKTSKVMKNKSDLKVNNKRNLDEEISSDEESVKHFSEGESDDNLVSAQEKKIILAKKYLEEIEKEERERLETGDIQSNVVNRLREDLLDQAGKLIKKVADKILQPTNDGMKILHCREHSLPITCIAISPDNLHIYSGSKDSVIVKWSLKSGQKLGAILSKWKEKSQKISEHLHTSCILSLAVSFDSKFLASSDESSIIRIWNTDLLSYVHSFKGHRGSVTGLAFCSDSNILYSCSKDRSVRIWNLNEMSFVETLFGHQCGVTSIDVLRKDKPVTSGGSDNTLRVWKVQEESQLIFNGHHKSIDCVKRLDQQHFISCGDDGQVCVWGVLKKKPLCVVPQAHGIDINNSEPNWITSVACYPNSDLIVSGSCDGCLQFWKCEGNFRNVTRLFTIPIVGFMNDIAFSKDGNFIVIGVGQEHKLGRWWREKKAKNSIIVISLQYQNGNS